MLTGDLVRVRIKQGELQPAWVDRSDPKLLEWAGELLALFTEGAGRRRGELEEELDAMTSDRVDVKLTRGLVKLILDRAEFDVSAPMPPPELRARVFREAARRGPIRAVAIEGGGATAADVFASIAVETGHDPSILAGALWADHADRQVLGEVEPRSPEWLLDRYNVALVQALLLKSEELRVRLFDPEPARARQFFRQVKFHQLIHAVRPMRDGWEIVLDGPASLFSQTTRYGLALAKLFPALPLQPGRWVATAKVGWTRGVRTLTVTSDQGLRSHYRDLGGYDTREATWFAERFTALDSGWELSRDATPLDQGGEAVVVPDFTFRKDGRVAHLEILGFWRKASVARRLLLLGRHGPPNLVLAVSRRLAGEAGELPEAVVPFAEVVPAKEVLRRVESVAR